MIGTCAACGNHEWDKEVIEDIIHCPKCGNSWKFKKLPIFFLTGCSGIGKTTTAQELQKLTGKFIALDADLFYNIMEPGGMKNIMICLSRYSTLQRISIKRERQLSGQWPET